jgi:hypothetical protein
MSDIFIDQSETPEIQWEESLDMNEWDGKLFEVRESLKKPVTDCG